MKLLNIFRKPKEQNDDAAYFKAYFESEIRKNGYHLRYVDWCEDSETPGFLGQIKGVTNHNTREVKISTKANPTDKDLCDILAHELKHVEDPDWDCGNRDVLGRGG